MSETTLELDEQQPQKRPVFVTVLCILTWIGSGITLLSGLFGFFTVQMAEKTYSELDKAAAITTEFGTLPSLEDYIYWTNISNISNVLVGILCIVGAILMFQLRKVGFFLYIAGCVIAMIVGFLSIQVLMPSGFSGIGMIGVVLGALISIAFIVMYGVNLKHMK
jgi:hypothetical protein